MEPNVGIEPTTYRLQGGCSTTELIRRTPSAYAPHTLAHTGTIPGGHKVAISQADRLEAYEAFTSVVGRKVSGTLMNELKEVDDGIIGLNHKVDLLAVRIESIEKSAATTNNWLRALFAVLFAFDSAILVLLLQSS